MFLIKNDPKVKKLQIHFVYRCRYQEQGAQPNSIVNFECPEPGLVGNTVTVQNLVSNLEVLEVEVLGKILKAIFFK